MPCPCGIQRWFYWPRVNTPTHHKTACGGVRRITKCLGNGLGANTCRVTQGDGDGAQHGLHAGLSTSINTCAKPSCAATWAATAGAPYRSVAWCPQAR